MEVSMSYGSSNPFGYILTLLCLAVLIILFVGLGLPILQTIQANNGLVYSQVLVDPRWSHAELEHSVDMEGLRSCMKRPVEIRQFSTTRNNRWLRVCFDGHHFYYQLVDWLERNFLKGGNKEGYYEKTGYLRTLDSWDDIMAEMTRQGNTWLK